MNFFDRFFGNASNKSGTIAKERLQFVLVQDRIKLPPDILDQMRDEIITVISKYVDIDQDGIDISVTKVASQSCLVANIPILRSKHSVR